MDKYTSAVISRFISIYVIPSSLELAATGLEHIQISTEKSQIQNQAAQNPAQLGYLPDDLAEVLEAWERLPDDVRRTILGVVRLSAKATQG